MWLLNHPVQLAMLRKRGPRKSCTSVARSRKKNKTIHADDVADRDKKRQWEHSRPQADRYSRSISTLARDPCYSTKSRIGLRGHLTTYVQARTAFGIGMADVDETFHVHDQSARDMPSPGIILPLAHAVPHVPRAPDLVSLPPPPFIAVRARARAQASVLLFSHHGRRTAVRELLLFVGRRPAQTAGFSMISNPFRCAYTRATASWTDHAETKSTACVRLTEFQCARSQETGN